MLCPNCDGLLAGAGCQGCGWRTGDPFPAHRFKIGAAHPFMPGAEYPERTGDPVAVPIVDMVEEVSPAAEPPAPQKARKRASAPPALSE